MALKVGPESRIRELELQHEGALEEQAVEHTGKLKEAVMPPKLLNLPRSNWKARYIRWNWTSLPPNRRS